MGADFLRKLLGPRAAPSPAVAEARAELDRLCRQRPTLSAPAALLHELLPDLVPEERPPPAPPLTAEHARTKRAGGVPLLRGESVSLDTGILRRRWLRVCAALARHGEPERARRLAAAVRRGSLGLDELVRAVLAGRPDEVYAWADALSLDPGLTATVLRLTLLPQLAAVHAVLAPLVQGLPWGRGSCPTCGSWPLLAEYRGLEQLRILRCGLCAAEWEVPRLLCPFCGNRDHRQLGYFSAEGEEGRYRAATCDACRGYVKAVATLGPLDVPGLLVADLATLHLDLAAADRGFSV
jgi:FdhE protein